MSRHTGGNEIRSNEIRSNEIRGKEIKDNKEIKDKENCSGPCSQPLLI